MATLLLGINHNTASIAIREKVAFAPEMMHEALKQACACAELGELAILSTCNRTELYCVPTHLSETQQQRQFIEEAVLNWLGEYHQLTPAELRQAVYVYWDDDAVRHVMKVASGLDSMVLGEPQILGQIKSAYAVAREAGSVDSSLNQIFEETFAIAKRVRTDTAIGESPVSVAFAAVALAQQIFADLSKASALMIGAGKTIELVVQHLRQNDVSNIVVANRTLTHALELKEKYGVRVVLLSEIPELLMHADIVVSSTASQLPILGKGAVEKALKARKHKPIFMVDLAVPRDIEPEVADLPDAYLYSVDDLKEVIDASVKSRQNAAAEAEAIINQGLEQFRKKLRSRNIVSSLKAFREKAEKIRDEELQKALRSLESGEDPKVVMNQLARLLTNKLIHSPSVQMKRASAEGHEELIQLAQILFELESQEATPTNQDYEDQQE
jgi:glutamyl-tRNA reductase